MGDVTVLWHVAVIWGLAVLTPGANVLLTLNTALTQGRHSASWAALGVTSAVFIWALLGVSGLLLLFKTFPWLLYLVQGAGGIYLLYLGYNKLYKVVYEIIKRHEVKIEPVPLTTSITPVYSVAPSTKSMFKTAMVTSLINPKTGLFVLSLFSVTLPDVFPAMLASMVVIIMCCITLMWHMTLAVVFSKSAAKNVYHKAFIPIELCCGGLFTYFGLRILLG